MGERTVKMSWIRDNLVLILILGALITSVLWIKHLSYEIDAIKKDIFHVRRIIQNFTIKNVEE